MKDLTQQFSGQPPVHARIVEAMRRQQRREAIEAWTRIGLLALAAVDLAILGLLLLWMGGVL